MPNTSWCLSEPAWWIDQIRRSCADVPMMGHRSPVNVREYFDQVSDNQVRTYNYVRSTPNLSQADVRRSLFFAKSMKKWRLDIGSISGEERKRKAMAGFRARNLAASDERYIPDLSEVMRRILSRWLPYPKGGRFSGWIDGRFGPGSVMEGYAHPQRYELLRRWADADLAAGISDGPVDWVGNRDLKPLCRLHAVPKDFDKDRLITIENTWGSFEQQRVRRLILESIHHGPLRGSVMDLRYTDGQEMQRRLALEASRTDGSHRATVDLSDASDGISWEAVQATFPTWVVDELAIVRSTAYVDPTEEDGRYPAKPHQLHMFGGMGNACTFVVETLFFSAYVVAYARTHGLDDYVSTFGDDIICSSDVAAKMLEEGVPPFFKINALKSFWGSDCMREACGIFAYQGLDVTVPKITGYTNTWEGREAAVTLHRNLSADVAPFLQDLAGRLGRALVASGVPNWPFTIEGYPSVNERSAYITALPIIRQNEQYQRPEARVITRTAGIRRFPVFDYKVDEDYRDVYSPQWMRESDQNSDQVEEVVVPDITPDATEQTDAIHAPQKADPTFTGETCVTTTAGERTDDSPYSARAAYRRRALPPACTWYYCSLLGMIHPEEGYVSIPDGTFRMSPRWLAIR